MVNHICKICNIDSLFFKWSTDRYLRRDKVLETLKKIRKVPLSKAEQLSIENGSYVICNYCDKKYGLSER